VWPAFADFSSLDGTWIPHGVCQIATEAHKRGHDVKVIDGRVMSREVTKSYIQGVEAEYVGISVLSAYGGYAKELISFIREKRPDIKIVIGGIHPSVCPEDFVEADYLVRGEGEITFSDILEGKHEPGIIEGVKPELGELAPIDRSLITTEEKPLPGLEEPFATVIIGRGCPYKCTFCQPAEQTLFGRRVRFRPVDHVVGELESLDIKSFMIHDDCFTADIRYAEAFRGSREGQGLVVVVSGSGRQRL